MEPDEAEAAGIAAAEHTLTPDPVAVLREVMTWIKNWSPSFVEDDEWAETQAKVDAVLSNG